MSVRLALLFVCLGCACSHARRPRWERLPDLPEPRANNAVAVVRGHEGPAVVSALGLAPGKQWSDVVSDAWSLGASGWSPMADVPGPGRLAATALGVGEQLYLVGGYTVAEDHTEVSVPGIDVWSPTSGRWSPGLQMPVPVDDAVAGLWRDRWMVLVSGWSNDGNVSDVQLLDLRQGRWTRGTPIPGPAVFGHAGGMWDDALVYCDGVRVVPATQGAKRSFVANEGCYLGRFGEDVGLIEWQALPAHPGVSRYRMAAGASSGLIVFAGGTDNPYNYDGTGYDGQPSKPTDTVFAWDLAEEAWVDLPSLPEPSMDHRGLVNVDGKLVLVGGLDAQRAPTRRVWQLVGL